MFQKRGNGASPTPPVPRQARLAHGEVLFDPALDAALVESWLQAAPGWFGEARTPLPAAPGKRSLALVAATAGDGLPVRLVVKRSRGSGLRASLAALGIGRSRAEHAFRMGLAVAAAGVPTPRVLACLAIGGRKAPVSYLVTEYVEAEGFWPTAAKGFAWAARLSGLARSMARLHDAGLRHRDLKAPNLYAVPGGSVGLVDLESAAWIRPGAATRSVRRDLGRLAASFASDAAVAAGVDRDDWRELVQLYAAERRRPPDVEALTAATLTWAHAKVERNRELGRPLA